jgi:hypothetical protein
MSHWYLAPISFLQIRNIYAGHLSVRAQGGKEDLFLFCWDEDVGHLTCEVLGFFFNI